MTYLKSKRKAYLAGPLDMKMVVTMLDIGTFGIILTQPDAVLCSHFQRTHIPNFLRTAATGCSEFADTGGFS
ncbi:hypothetical protein M8818_002787 [Zalaria obscura]|uniref:Uncharacterized protein n=1 Tax=Zalaria obscura TaxID=2024903 RepID=A0ACC3SHG0_9PEZI